MNLDILTVDVIGDVAIVIGVSSLLGAVARRCGQPTVIGHIIAGIGLAPSLLGAAAWASGESPFYARGSTITFGYRAACRGHSFSPWAMRSISG